MEIQFKKGKDGQNTISCIRTDGSTTWSKLYPGFISHDLAHYAVETILELKHSFFGLVNNGWDITTFEVRYKKKELPVEAIQTEFIVNLLQTELAQGNYFEHFNAMLQSNCQSKGVPLPATISNAHLTAIRERLQINLMQWKVVKYGEKLILHFE